MATTIPHQRSGRFRGRRVLLVMLLFWLAVLAVVYVYVVRLKLKGERGLREDAAPAPTVQRPS